LKFIRKSLLFTTVAKGKRVPGKEEIANIDKPIDLNKWQKESP
jgi:hypothetical protein